MSIAQIQPIGFRIGEVDNLLSLPDEALLTLSLKTPSAFEVLVARYQNQFMSRAQAVVGTRDSAEDVVQETFVRVYRFGNKFTGEQGSFKAWSLTILMNVARTHYSRSAKNRSHTAPLEPEHYESLATTNIQQKDGQEAYAKEVIAKALEKAPTDVADILRLAFLEGLPHADIAEKLGLSTAAVKTRVHRARAV